MEETKRDSLAALPTIRWEDESQDLLTISAKLPRVIKRDSRTKLRQDNAYVAGQLDEPFLAFNIQYTEKVIASIPRGEMDSTDEVADTKQFYSVPTHSKLWFSLLDSNITEYTSIGDFKESNVTSFLTTTPLRAERPKVRNDQEYEKITLLPGEVVKMHHFVSGRRKQSLGQISIVGGIVSGSKKIKTKFLQCSTETDETILISKKENGVFYATQVDDKFKQEECVTQMKQLLQCERRFPLDIVIRFGRMPSSTSFKDRLRLEKIVSENVIVAATLKNHYSLFDIARDTCPLKFVVDNRDKRLVDSDAYQNAISMCNSDITAFLEDVKDYAEEEAIAEETADIASPSITSALVRGPCDQQEDPLQPGDEHLESNIVFTEYVNENLDPDEIRRPDAENNGEKGANRLNLTRSQTFSISTSDSGIGNSTRDSRLSAYYSTDDSTDYYKEIDDAIANSFAMFDYNAASLEYTAAGSRRRPRDRSSSSSVKTVTSEDDNYKTPNDVYVDETVMPDNTYRYMENTVMSDDICKTSTSDDMYVNKTVISDNRYADKTVISDDIYKTVMSNDTYVAKTVTSDDTSVNKVVKAVDTYVNMGELLANRSRVVNLTATGIADYMSECAISEDTIALIKDKSIDGSSLTEMVQEDLRNYFPGIEISPLDLLKINLMVHEEWKPKMPQTD